MDASLLTHNVAKLVELPPAVQPKLWPPERIVTWRRASEVRHPVMARTGDLTGASLDSAVNHRLYPLFHLIATPARVEARGTAGVAPDRALALH